MGKMEGRNDTNLWRIEKRGQRGRVYLST